jgi:hypothetical protein
MFAAAGAAMHGLTSAAAAAGGGAKAKAPGKGGGAGKPRADDSHILLGLTVPFVRQWALDHGMVPTDATYRASAIAREIGRTSGGSSVAEVHARDVSPTAGMPVVAEANVFVSHAQSRPLFTTLDALESWMALHGLDPLTTYCWLDCLVLRQNELSSTWLYTAIGTVVSHIGTVVLVVDLWPQPACLERAWYALRCGCGEYTFPLPPNRCPTTAANPPSPAGGLRERRETRCEVAPCDAHEQACTAATTSFSRGPAIAPHARLSLPLLLCTARANASATPPRAHLWRPAPCARSYGGVCVV